MLINIYNSIGKPVLHCESSWYLIDRPWNELANDDSLFEALPQTLPNLKEDTSLAPITKQTLAPMTDHEIWAAGARGRN